MRWPCAAISTESLYQRAPSLDRLFPPKAVYIAFRLCWPSRQFRPLEPAFQPALHERGTSSSFSLIPRSPGVLALRARGLSLRAIAGETGVSVMTIQRIVDAA